MEYRDDKVIKKSSTSIMCCNSSSSPSSLSPSSPANTSSDGSPSNTITTSAPQVILSPCAACKILRRRCVEKCVLAPYFPPTDPLKFTIAHKVFGASNIIKLLQELPESHRADAVNSLVYEANARIRDPVYGCAGAICQLQKQVSELQAQLAKAQAEILNMQCQNTNLVSLICMEMSSSSSSPLQQQQHQLLQNQETTTPSEDYNQFYQYDHEGDTTAGFLVDDANIILGGGASWEPLWA